jgi:uncharacterized protein
MSTIDPRSRVVPSPVETAQEARESELTAERKAARLLARELGASLASADGAGLDRLLQRASELRGEALQAFRRELEETTAVSGALGRRLAEALGRRGGQPAEGRDPRGVVAGYLDGLTEAAQARRATRAAAVPRDGMERAPRAPSPFEVRRPASPLPPVPVPAEAPTLPASRARTLPGLAKPEVRPLPSAGVPGGRLEAIRLGAKAERLFAPGRERIGAMGAAVERARRALAGAEKENPRVRWGVRQAEGAIGRVAERLEAASRRVDARALAQAPAAEALERVAQARAQLVAVRAHAGEARQELAEIRGWKTTSVDVPAAERAMGDVAELARRAEGELGLAGGRARVAAGVHAREAAKPGAQASPDAQVTARRAPQTPAAAGERLALELGLTETDLAAVGAALPRDRIPPQMLWSQEMVNNVCDAGKAQGVATEEQLHAWGRLTAGALGIESDAQPLVPLDVVDLVAVLKSAGVDLARVDPGQLRAALAHVMAQKTRPAQGWELAKVVLCFEVLDKIALPRFDKRYLMAEIERATRISGAATFKLSDTAIQEKFQEIARVANAGGEFRDKFGKYSVELKVAADGSVEHTKTKKKSFWSKLGDAFKKVLPIALTVLSFVPVTAPFALVANAAYSAYNAVRSGSVLGAVAAAAGLVGGGAALVASKLASGAATVATRVATIANTASRTLKGIEAARQGGLAGLAGIASAVAGGVGSVAGSLGQGFQSVADKLGTWADRVSKGLYAADAVQRGDYLSAAGIGAGLASDFRFTGERADAILGHIEGGAIKAGAAQAAIERGDYAAAAAALAGLAGQVTDGKARAGLEKASTTLGYVSQAQRLIESKDYLSASSALMTAASSYVGSTATRQTLQTTAGHLARAGHAFESAKGGDYLGAAESLTRLVGELEWDEATKGHLEEAAAVFRQASGIHGAIRSGDYPRAASLVSGLAAAYAGRPRTQEAFARSASLLEQAAPVPGLIAAGEYAEAGALLNRIAQEQGLRLGRKPREIAPTQVVQVADELEAALETGDYERAAALLTEGGGEGPAEGLPAPTAAVYTVRAGDTLSAIAARVGVPLQEMLRLNPQIQNPDLIRVGQEIRLPGGAAVPTPTPSSFTGETAAYTVQAGDTLSGIASRAGVPLATLLAANPAIADPNLIRAGQVIRVPVVAGAPVPSIPGPGPSATSGVPVPGVEGTTAGTGTSGSLWTVPAAVLAAAGVPLVGRHLDDLVRLAKEVTPDVARQLDLPHPVDVSKLTPEQLATLEELRQGKGFLDRFRGWSWSDLGHAALDIGGFFPGLGEGADVANAAWYVAEGKYLDAGLSLISMIPVVGDAIGKGGRYALRLGPDAAKGVLRALDKVDVLRFLDRFADHPKLGPHIRMIHDAVRKWIDDVKGATRQQEPVFTGTLRGVDVTLPGVRVQTIRYTKRTADDLAQLRRAFNGGIRADFLKSLASDPRKVAALREAGLDDTAIAKIGDGLVPTGWEVHHKLPLDDGGTNDFANLVLIKNEPYHKVVTNAQNAATSGLQPGQTIVIEYPMVPGFVYPPRG